MKLFIKNRAHAAQKIVLCAQFYVQRVISVLQHLLSKPD